MRGTRQVVASRGIDLGAPDDEVPDVPVERMILDMVCKCAWRRIQERGLLEVLADAWRDWDGDEVRRIMHVEVGAFADGDVWGEWHVPGCAV